jgi:hypothetical protein
MTNTSIIGLEFFFWNSKFVKGFKGAILHIRSITQKYAKPHLVQNVGCKKRLIDSLIAYYWQFYACSFSNLQH